MRQMQLVATVGLGMVAGIGVGMMVEGEVVVIPPQAATKGTLVETAVKMIHCVWAPG